MWNIIQLATVGSTKLNLKLRGLNVDRTFMRMFYCCFIESILTFSSVCWFGSLSFKNKKRLQGITKVCSKIAGPYLEDLSHLYKVRSLKKAQSISADPSHPLSADSLCCHLAVDS